MNPNLVKSALVSIGVHLSLLVPFFPLAAVSNPPRVDLPVGMSAVELEWVHPRPAEPEGEEEALAPVRPPSEPREQWLEEVGVAGSSAAADSGNRPPLYPRDARLLGWQGTVFIEAMVDPAGQVVSARINQSSRYASLDGAALAAVRQWRFRPAQRRGRKVASRVEIPVTFKLKQNAEP